MMNDNNAQGETIDVWRKRLTFRAWHRGTREMDLLIGSFADQNINNFGAVELREFENILLENDPDVYDWIIGQKTVPDNLRGGVMDLLLRHKFA